MSQFLQRFQQHRQSIKSAVVLAYFGAYAVYVHAASSTIYSSPLISGACKFYQNYLNNDFFAVAAGLGGMGLVGKHLLDEGDQKLKSSGFKWAAVAALVVNSPTLAGYATGGTFCGSGSSSSVSNLFTALMPDVLSRVTPLIALVS